MDEQNFINSALEICEPITKVETKMIDPRVPREPWLKRNKFGLLLGITGALVFALLNTLVAWQKTKQQLFQTTNTLNWIAQGPHRQLREELEFTNRLLKDYNYFKFLKTVYEAKDRDFFETLTIAYEESMRQKISPWDTLSIIWVESGFKQYISSPSSHGYMQVNYNAWKDEKGLDMVNIFDKKTNIRVGIEIYKHYLGLAGGDKMLALFYYNNGTRQSNPNLDYAPAVMKSKYMKLAANYIPIEQTEQSKGISQ
ncbi:MAG TPA: lytic transglycosylase domain-containing protein [Candidatus Binatia bacterium]|nr:lytic transglycosylase domain-containing protein [Candidatus Binatia bacterium]